MGERPLRYVAHPTALVALQVPGKKPVFAEYCPVSEPHLRVLHIALNLSGFFGRNVVNTEILVHSSPRFFKVGSWLGVAALAPIRAEKPAVKLTGNRCFVMVPKHLAAEAPVALHSSEVGVATQTKVWVVPHAFKAVADVLMPENVTKPVHHKFNTSKTNCAHF